MKSFKNFFNSNKKKREAIEQFAVPDVPVEQLLERFHSDSAATVDINRKRILQSAAAVAEQNIVIRDVAINTRQGAAETCRQLQRLRDDSLDVRASQEVFRASVDATRHTFSAQSAAVEGIRDHSVAEAEHKLESLSTMADHVATATEQLGANMRAMSRSRARSQRRNGSGPVPRMSSDRLDRLQTSCHDCSVVVTSLEEKLAGLAAVDHELQADLGSMRDSVSSIEATLGGLEARVAAVQALAAC